MNAVNSRCSRFASSRARWRRSSSSRDSLSAKSVPTRATRMGASIGFSVEAVRISSTHGLEAGAAATLPAEEIVARCQRADVSRHPYFVALARGPVDLQAVYLLMANLREGISRYFVAWLARTIERIEDRRAACLLAKQLNDELGSGDVSQIHGLLLDRFVSALSPWRPPGDDEMLLRAGRSLAEDGARPFARPTPTKDWARSSSGRFSPKRWTPAWRQRCGARRR